MAKDAEKLVFDDMRSEHLKGVIEIERQSFPMPWTANAFLYEITCNNLAHYVVAIKDGKIVGYAGMWIVLEDAHITNIAVSPECRQKNYGKRILIEMMLRASLLGASKMTLEVRVSNVPARRLYSGLGFVECGRRKRYYTDNNEDAIIMWKDDLGSLAAGNVWAANKG